MGKQLLSWAQCINVHTPRLGCHRKVSDTNTHRFSCQPSGTPYLGCGWSWRDQGLGWESSQLIIPLCYSYLNKLPEQRQALGADTKMWTGMPTFHVRVPGFESPLHFLSSIPANVYPGKQWWRFNYMGPCHPGSGLQPSLAQDVAGIWGVDQ